MGCPPHAHVVGCLLGGAESRQDEGGPAGGADSERPVSPSAPQQPGRAPAGQGPGVSSDAGIRGPRSSFGLSLGPKDAISRSQGSNLGRTAALRAQRRLRSGKL